MFTPENAGWDSSDYFFKRNVPIALHDTSLSDVSGTAFAVRCGLSGQSRAFGGEFGEAQVEQSALNHEKYPWNMGLGSIDRGEMGTMGGQATMEFEMVSIPRSRPGRDRFDPLHTRNFNQPLGLSACSRPTSDLTTADRATDIAKRFAGHGMLRVKCERLLEAACGLFVATLSAEDKPKVEVRFVPAAECAADRGSLGSFGFFQTARSGQQSTEINMGACFLWRGVDRLAIPGGGSFELTSCAV